MKLAAWNINSIRARKARLLAWLDSELPDVLCLSETKVQDEQFPSAEILERGYHLATYGEKAYNGVALLSRAPLADVARGLGDDVSDPQCRLISATTFGLRVVSLYVPNGGELTSDKFTYKLAWLARLRAYLERTAKPDQPVLLGGDFNIVPRNSDATFPEAWRESVLMHPRARAALENVMAWGLTDLFAAHHPRGGLYSWWDYRRLAFPRDDGLRIDLWLGSAPLAARCLRAWIDRDARKGLQPSDHAPVLIELEG